MKVCTREIEYVCVHSLISHPHQAKAYECDLRNTSTSSKYVVNTQSEQLVPVSGSVSTFKTVNEQVNALWSIIHHW